ncbi:MAG TPA: flavodoxin domain-containing protein [Actinopolymorphaceae bacterium]
MRALVIYESMFGNTEVVARAIAEGIAEHLDVESTEVGDAPTSVPDDVVLLAVGGPTHAFGMSRASTRRSADEQADGPLVSRGRGIREWLEELGRCGHRCYGGVFDTKLSRRWLPGSATRGAARQLARRNVDLAVDPIHFYVTGPSGPLIGGETDRARDWGARLARSVPTGT